jgi:hypothetical protein
MKEVFWQQIMQSFTIVLITASRCFDKGDPAAVKHIKQPPGAHLHNAGLRLGALPVVSRSPIFAPRADELHQTAAARHAALASLICSGMRSCLERFEDSQPTTLRHERTQVGRKYRGFVAAIVGAVQSGRALSTETKTGCCAARLSPVQHCGSAVMERRECT